MATTDHVHPDALTLAQLLLAEWPAARERIRLCGHPTCDGGEDADADADKDTDADTDDADSTDEDTDKGDDDQDDDKGTKDEPDWKKLARRHEREAKAARKREADLQTKLKQRDDADKSEQQKAIDKAREDATAEVTTKYEAQQRTDRIENAVTKLSLRGFKAKSDGKEITLKFADPDDAQLRVDRALRNGDLTYEDIYSDGKVQTSVVIDFLTELLEEHPRLRAQDNASTAKGAVDFDAGKGNGGGGKSLEDMSPDDHLKAIRGSR